MTDGNDITVDFIREGHEKYCRLSDYQRKHLRIVLPSGKSLDFYIGFLAASTAFVDSFLRSGTASSPILITIALYNARLCYILANLPIPKMLEFCNKFAEFIEDSANRFSRMPTALPPEILQGSTEEINWNEVFRETSEEREGEGRL